MEESWQGSRKKIRTELAVDDNLESSATPHASKNAEVDTDEDEVIIVDAPVVAPVKNLRAAPRGSRKKMRTELAANDRGLENEEVGTDDDEVIIVDAPVVSPLKNPRAAAASMPANCDETDDIEVLGTANALELPHMRCHCTENPFCDMDDGVLSTSQTLVNRKACSLCYCYVCDVPVKDCPDWNNSHCNATDKGGSKDDWSALRKKKRREKESNKPAVFEARLANGKFLKNVIMLLRAFVKDFVLNCNEEEIYFEFMDEAHGSLVSFRLSADAFDRFRCDNSLKLGMHMRVLAAALKEIKRKTDVLVMKATKTTLTLIVESKNERNGAKPIVLDVTEGAEEDIYIPPTEYKCTCRMPSALLKRTIHNLMCWDRYCGIAAGENGTQRISFKTCSPDMYEGCVSRAAFHFNSNAANKSEKEQIIVDIDPNQAFEARFALRYLNLFTKGPLLSSCVYLNLSPDFPMKIEYPLLGGKDMSRVGHLKLFLAPCFDDDEF